MMFWAFQGRPPRVDAGLLTVLVGGVIFAVSKSRQQSDERV